MSDLTENELAVVEWAVPLHTTIWRSLVLALNSHIQGRGVRDLPPEFAKLEWLTEGNRWILVRKEIALRRRRAQYAENIPKRRKQQDAFRARRRAYMRAYRARNKKPVEERWLND